MNQAELTRLIEESKPVVLSAIRKYLGAANAMHIDDAAQEAYLRIYRNYERNTFPDERSCRNWMYTIAKNESLRIATRSQKQDLPLDEIFLQTIAAPESEFNGDFFSDLDAAVSLLHEDFQRIMKLYIGGKSEDEIGAELKLKKGTVKSRLHRARTSLASKLTEMGYSV